MAKKLTIICIRAALSMVFVWAGVAKLSAPEYTHMAVFQYQIASWELSEWIAAYLPWLELFVGIGLWIPRLRLGAAVISSCLNVVFLAAIVSAIIRELDITCGCFGAADSGAMLAPRLIQDFVLLVSSLFLLKEDAHPLDAQLQLSQATDY
jgi:putative oxidoreductase